MPVVDLLEDVQRVGEICGNRRGCNACGLRQVDAQRRRVLAVIDTCLAKDASDSLAFRRDFRLIVQNETRGKGERLYGLIATK
jgi:hypothetical protein